MQLFDEALIRRIKDKFGVQKRGIPEIANLILNPKFTKERQRIRSWFSDIPEINKSDIKGRFISEKAGSHIGAYNELVVDQLLHKNSIEHEHEPKVKEGSPDFLAKAPNMFYIEATSVFESRIFLKSKKNAKILHDELDDISCRINGLEDRFYVYAMPYNIPSNLENLKYQNNVENFLRQWANKLDSSDPDLKNTESIYDKDGLKLKFSIVGIEPGKCGLKLAGTMGGSKWIGEAVLQIHKALDRKMKYKSIEKPYVVALSLEDKDLELKDIIELLFGIETTRIGKSHIQIGEIQMDNSGLFSHGMNSGKKFQYKKLSAVLIIRSNLVSSNENDIRMHNFAVIHNPYANHQLSSTIFNKYNQLVVDCRTGTKIAMKWTKQDCIYILL